MKEGKNKYINKASSEADKFSDGIFGQASNRSNMLYFLFKSYQTS